MDGWMDGWMDGTLSGGHIPRIQALGSDRFLSHLTKRHTAGRDSALPPPPPKSTHVGSDSAPPPPQCAEVGIVRILSRRRDEGWVGGRGGWIY